MTGFLTAIVVILGLIAVGQIIRIFELSADISGKDENKVTDKDNKIQGILMLVILVLMVGGFIWFAFEWWHTLLPVSASEHGVETDKLMWVSMAVIITVFLITHPVLFYFAYKYRGRKGHKAEYIEHNNKLELIWTLIPAVVLAGLILYGLTTWSNVMNEPLAGDDTEEPLVIEIYGYQFNWRARYAGGDGELGYANVRMIDAENQLGVDMDDEKSLDDIVVSELHLPVNRPVEFKFRAQEVIHSAYIPHFRLQMNCVPGMTTRFRFTPTVTTEEMRAEKDVVRKVESINEYRKEIGEDPWQFDYVLLCNKICGSSHYNMQMNIVVEEEEEFEEWLNEQNTLADNL